MESTFQVSSQFRKPSQEAKICPESHKYTLLTPEEEKFVPNMTSDVNRMEVRKNWDMLMPRRYPTTPTRL